MLAVGNFKGWMSQDPFVLKRSAIDTAGWSTRAYAYGIEMLEDNGRRLSVGQNPSRHPLMSAVAAIGRQLHATSVSSGRVSTFRDVAKFLCRKVIQEVSDALRPEQLNPVIDRKLFDELLAHKPASFRDDIWQMHENAQIGRVDGDYRRAGAFVKQEDSHKSDTLRTIKPRAISTQTPEMYVRALPVLLVQHLLYNTPVLRQWMTKGKTKTEVYDMVKAIISQSHVSQDVSGFEKAMTVEMRIVEIELITKLLKVLGLSVSAAFVHRIMKESRHISTKYYSYSVGVRCSGDYWTSLGNGLANICIILTGHYVKHGDGRSLDDWWLEARDLKFVTEGDDALIPESVVDRSTTKELMMELSLATSADVPGGADFLKTTFYPVFDSTGSHCGRLGNTLRWCRSLMFVRGERLRPGKVRFLWRAKALSLLYLAPNHPIITSLCYRIDELTRGARWFRGAEQLSRKWGLVWEDLGDIEKAFPRGKDWEVSEALRIALAHSTCPELPPISVDSQLIMEESFRNWSPGQAIQICGEWRAYPEYGSAMSDVRVRPEPIISEFKDAVVASLWHCMLNPSP